MQNPAGHTVPLSVLDVVPMRTGLAAHDAYAETVALAQHAEALGYHRYWFAEHHGMPGIASSSPPVLIGHIAQQSSPDTARRALQRLVDDTGVDEVIVMCTAPTPESRLRSYDLLMQVCG